MNLFDKLSLFADDVADVVNGAIGTVVCGAADVADTSKFRGTQFTKDVTTPLTSRVESLVDSIKP